MTICAHVGCSSIPRKSGGIVTADCLQSVCSSSILHRWGLPLAGKKAWHVACSCYHGQGQGTYALLMITVQVKALLTHNAYMDLHGYMYRQQFFDFHNERMQPCRPLSK